MIAKVRSYALIGLDGVAVTVETDVSKGIPAYEIVGLPDAAVKESKERVRSAIRNSALEFPAHKITVNLAPAYVKKAGSAFDLPVAVSLLLAYGVLQAQTKEIFQIISLVVTILSVLASLALTLFKWYNTANADGHITPDEVADAVKKTADAIDEVKDAVDGVKGEDNGKRG